MKKYLDIFIIITLAVCCIYLGVSLYICKNKKIPIAKAPISLDSSRTNVPIVEYTDKAGVKHAVVNNNLSPIIDRETTQAATELQPVIEQVANNLGIKPSQIESGISVSSQAARDSVAFLKRQLETAQKLTFYYKDKYLTLNVKTNPLDSTDLGSFDYTYNADLNIVQYYKKDWFLGAKKSYIDISSNDKNATVMGVKKFTVKHPAPEFGIRIQGTIGHSFITGATSVGPSVRMDFGNKIKGSVRVSGLYNTKEQTFGTSITFDKDIWRW